MRSIKFRVWSIRPDESKMLYLFPEDTYFTSTDLIETDEWKVMQYTGLKDKNGKEIYEFDYLEFLPIGSTRNINGVVEWLNDRWTVRELNGNERYSLFYQSFGQPKIIGNIYNQTDLLNS